MKKILPILITVFTCIYTSMGAELVYPEVPSTPQATTMLLAFQQTTATGGFKAPLPIKKYRCDAPGCEYAATQSGHLKTHKLTHTGEKPFACTEPGCEYITRYSISLKRHLLVHHIGAKPFACDEPGCEYAANRSDCLKRHKLTHTGEKPFACTEPGCEYTTTRSSVLKTHALTHTCEKPFVCTEPGCNYATTQSSNLRRHFLRTHNINLNKRRRDEVAEDEVPSTPGAIDVLLQLESNKKFKLIDEN